MLEIGKRKPVCARFCAAILAVLKRCTVVRIVPRDCERVIITGGASVSPDMSRGRPRRTERVQPTRLETRTKESDTDASTRVASPRAQ